MRRTKKPKKKRAAAKSTRHKSGKRKARDQLLEPEPQQLLEGKNVVRNVAARVHAKG